MEPQSPADGVWIFTSALYQTTSTVIKTDHEIFIVDPNWLPHEVQAISDFVLAHKEHRSLYLIFTHSDYDHIIGYRAFSPVGVIASKAFVENPRKDQDVKQTRHFDLSHFIVRPYPIDYPDVQIVIDHDGQIVPFRDTQLTFYLSPGHTAEGLFIIYEPKGIWIAGDYLSDIEFPLVNDSFKAYRETLSKTDHILQNHRIEYLIPGHGTFARVPEIRRRKNLALKYLDDIKASIESDNPFQEASYREEYPFWEGIRDWHEENLSVAQLELGES